MFVSVCGDVLNFTKSGNFLNKVKIDELRYNNRKNKAVMQIHLVINKAINNIQSYISFFKTWTFVVSSSLIYHEHDRDNSLYLHLYYLVRECYCIYCLNYKDTYLVSNRKILNGVFSFKPVSFELLLHLVECLRLYRYHRGKIK